MIKYRVTEKELQKHSWGTKEWKAKRAVAIEGKVCAWCGSVVALAVHHDAEPRVTGLAKWKSIYRSLDKSPKHRGLSPERLTELTNERFEAWRAEYEKTYMDFENVVVLCRRCHYALHKGKKLCERCRKNYHNPRYPVCYQCNLESEGLGAVGEE